MESSKPYILDNSTINGGDINWLWNADINRTTTMIDEKRKQIIFHPHSSIGTTAARGEKKLMAGFHHIWELRSSNIFGTDVMVGIGTSECNINARSGYQSLIGLCKNSWGFSYHGRIHHNGLTKKYGEKWPNDSLIGIHLDLHRGTLEFYLNRRPLGIAFSNLTGSDYYPLVSSTSVKSQVEIVSSFSFISNLQFMSYSSVRKNYRSNLKAILPPGLNKVLGSYEYFFISTGFYSSNSDEDEEDDKKDR